MTPIVAETYLQSRRQQIVDAAWECFMEKGFHRATMQDICKRAKLSPGAVYNYFTSKDDIVVAAAEESQKRNAEMIDSAVLTDTINPLGNVAKLYLSLMREEQCVRGASVDLELFSESTRAPKIAEALKSNIGALLDQITNLVRSRQREGIFNAQLDSLAVARALVAMFQGILIQRAIDPGMDIGAFGSVVDALLSGRFSKAK